MANIELTDVVDSLQRLQLNYTSLVTQFYNIFFNPNAPEFVSIVFLNEKGEEVEVAVPTRVSDRRYINYGSTKPADSPRGAIFLDTTDGQVYVKYGDGTSDWTGIVRKADLDSYIIHTSGDDLTSRPASEGTIAVNTTDGHVFIRRNGKWIRIDSYATGKITEKFILPSSDSSSETQFYSIKLDGSCSSVENLSIYEDGLKLDPELYSMPYGDNQTIVFSQERPIKIPGEGEKVELLVEYFTDIHETDAVAENRLVQYMKNGRFFSEGISPGALDTPDMNEYKGDVYDYAPGSVEIEGAVYLVDVDTTDLNVGDYYYITSSKLVGIWNGEKWIQTSPAIQLREYKGTLDATSYAEGEKEEGKTYLIDVDTTTLNIGDYFYINADYVYKVWDGSEWNTLCSARYYYQLTAEKYASANLDITNALNEIANAGEAAVEQWNIAIADSKNEIISTANQVDTQARQVQGWNTSSKDYAEQTLKNRNAVSQMVDNCRMLESSTAGYARYVDDVANNIYLKPEIDDKFSHYYTKDETFNQAKISGDIAQAKSEVAARIESVHDELTQKLSDQNNDMQTLQLSLTEDIKTTNSTFDNYVATHSDLGNFSNGIGYYNRENFPIDVNGIYHYSTDIPLTSTNIELRITKDCSYYAVDIGEYMASLQNPGDTTFTVSIKPNKSSIDFSLPDKMSENEETSKYNNVVCVVRCFIKNDTEYTPTIEWDYSGIEWLGAEPELEPGKSYIIEFISYDMTNSWKAHVLGICQPAIEVDSFTVMFTVDTNAMSTKDYNDGIAVSDTRMVAIIDGKDFVLDEVQPVDNTVKSKTVSLNIERKFIGKELTDFKIKSTNTPAFERYYSDTPLSITLAQNSNYNISCNTKLTEKNESAYTYALSFTSEYIDNYLRHGLTEAQFIKYLEQVESEADQDPENPTYITVAHVEDLPEEGDASKFYIVTDVPDKYYLWDEAVYEYTTIERILPDTPFSASDYTIDGEGQVIFPALTLTGKFKFDRAGFDENTYTLNATYYYKVHNTDTSYENGAMFTFGISSGVLDDPLVVKVDDNHLTGIKVRFDEMDAGFCLSEYGTYEVKTAGTVFISAETLLNDWNEDFPEIEE